MATLLSIGRSAPPAAKAPEPQLSPPRFHGIRTRNRALSVVLRFSVPLLLLAAWQLASSLQLIKPEVLASPASVAGAFRELWETGELVRFLGASGRRAAIGVTLGVLAGLILGVLSGISALGEELVDPTMQMYRAVPFLALVPLLISWLGVDETFKIVLIAVSAVAPMYAYTYLGVRGVDRRLVEAARGFGLSGVGLVRAVVIPCALPNILMALRICLSVSLTGLIAAEQIGTTEGIGYLVTLSQQYFRNDYMVLCILLYAVLGVLVDLGVRLLERLALPWRTGVAAR